MSDIGKFIFACILILLALWAIAVQQGADKAIKDSIESGRTGAVLRGL